MDFITLLYLIFPFGAFFCWKSVGNKIVLLPLFLQILFRVPFFIPMLGTRFELKVHWIAVFTLIAGLMLYAWLCYRKRAEISNLCIALYLTMLCFEYFLIGSCNDLLSKGVYA